MLNAVTLQWGNHMSSLSEHYKVGRFLRAKRESLEYRGLSLTQLEIAEALGYSSQSYIARLELGKVHIAQWNLSKLEQLFDVYQLTHKERNELIDLARIELPDADPQLSDAAMSMLSTLEVHPDWGAFPVYGSVSAGDKGGNPIEGAVAYFPI